MKKTSLYETHVKLGAKIIDFGGWLMPVQYSSIIDEHTFVRKSAGIFDVSHMGEIYVSGPDSKKFANFIITNDIAKIRPGFAMYSPMCYENGGCVDDVLIYCINPDEFLFVVNASNIEKDYKWMKAHSDLFDVKIQNLSKLYGQIAVQGPVSEEILSGLTDEDLSKIKFFGFKSNMRIGGIRALVSRSGYTGEDGFEIYAKADKIQELFKIILKSGGNRIKPCGLGARDTLRFESCLPLYGHELSENISPLQAGLKHFIKLNKAEFIGRTALINELKSGDAKKSAGFKMLERGIARNGYKIFSKLGDEIGYVTSGSICPTLSKNMGMTLIDYEYATPGIEIYVGIRNKKVKAITVEKPFYKKKYKKQEG